MASLPLEARNRRTMLIAFGAAAAMLGLSYASVPLYRLFCEVTGFGGTTQRDMPWSFEPLQVTDRVSIGQSDMAIYVARNDSSVPITGTATFNVEPEAAGKYFNKIQCFCFTEQTLQPGQQVRMPVLYYVDPAALDDPNMAGVEQITLSYTFHRVKSGEQPSS